MYFKQIIVEGMGCLSYLIGCPQAKIACVVDPKRDVQDYINLARDNVPSTSALPNRPPTGSVWSSIRTPS